MSVQTVGELLRECERQGFAVVRNGRGHWRVTPPDPAQPIIVVHNSVRSHRALRNAVADLRRVGLEV